MCLPNHSAFSVLSRDATGLPAPGCILHLRRTYAPTISQCHILDDILALVWTTVAIYDRMDHVPELDMVLGTSITTAG